MKAILAWFGTVVGKVVGIFLAALLIIGIWKWQWVYDRARVAWWGQKMTSANVHGANADTAIKGADSAAAVGVIVTREFDALTNSPEIRSNPGAVRVASSARTVIDTKNTEIGQLRTAVAEKTKEVQDVRDAGEKPVPRISPYADLGYTVSLTKKYGVPTVRAGVTYRVVGWAHVKGELSYEPPPAISEQRLVALEAINERDLGKAEIRATLTAHFKF